MDQKKIDRINALYHKSKAEGTPSKRVYRIGQKQFEGTVK